MEFCVVSWDVEALRHWVFEGSNDNNTWTVLREHVNDTTLCKKGQASIFALGDSISHSFSIFRVRMTKQNDNNHWYLALSGFDVYGSLVSAPVRPHTASAVTEAVAPVSDAVAVVSVPVAADNVLNFDLDDDSDLDGDDDESEDDTDLTADETDLRRCGGRTFTYQSRDMDKRGVLYWLGSMQKTTVWQNPAERGLVRVTMSSLQSDSKPASFLVGRTAVRCVTKAGSPTAPASFVVDLLERRVRPTHYTLRHYSSFDKEALRDWTLSGSLDGFTWVTLKDHKGDMRLNAKGQCATWELAPIVSGSRDVAAVSSRAAVASDGGDCAYSKFRVQMTGPNSNNHNFLCCSGFELYGTLLPSPTSSATMTLAPLVSSQPLWFASLLLLQHTANVLATRLPAVVSTPVSVSTSASTSLPAAFVRAVATVVAAWASEKQPQRTSELGSINVPNLELEVQAFHEKWTLAADEQLVRAINEMCEKKNMSSFTATHAETFVLAPAELMQHPLLATHSARDIAIRTQVLVELNTMVLNAIPLVDLSLPRGVSTVCDSLRVLRTLILWVNKRELWERALDKTKNPNSTLSTVNFDMFLANSLKEKRRTDFKATKTLFGQAFQQLKGKDALIFRLDKNKQLYKTVFVGMFAGVCFRLGSVCVCLCVCVCVTQRMSVFL